MKQYNNEYCKRRFAFYDLMEATPLQKESLRMARSKANDTGIRMLDLGCGDGRHLYSYEKEGMLGLKDKVVALDYSNEALILTKEIVPRVIIVQGYALNMPFEDNSFDFVFCSMLIEHVPDDELLHEIQRILVSGGVLHLTTVIRRPYAPFRTRSAEERLVLARNHLTEYRNSQEIIDLVAGNGFIAHQTQSYVFKVSLVHRFLMLGLKWRLFDLSAEKRMTSVQPLIKRYIKLFALPVPIIGYNIFEGIFMESAK